MNHQKAVIGGRYSSLADRLVGLQNVEHISIKTFEQTLKNVFQPHTKKQWFIPSKENRTSSQRWKVC